MKWLAGLFAPRPATAEADERLRRRATVSRFGEVCGVIGFLGSHYCWICEVPLTEPRGVAFFGAHRFCDLWMDIAGTVFMQEVRRAQISAVADVGGHLHIGKHVGDCDNDNHVTPSFAGEREHVLSVACWCGVRRDSENDHVVIHYRYPEA